MLRGNAILYWLATLAIAVITLAGVAYSQPANYFQLDQRIRALERNAALSRYLPGRLEGNIDFLGGIRIPRGAGAGLVLQSDAAGNASWGTFNGGGGDGDSSYLFLPGRSWTSGQIAYGSNSSTGVLELHANQATNHARIMMQADNNIFGDNIFFRDQSMPNAITQGQGFDLNMGAGFANATLAGGLQIQNTGINGPNLSVVNQSTGSAANQMVQIDGKIGQTAALLRSYFGSGLGDKTGASTANHMEFYGPGRSTPNSYVDSIGVWHGPMSGTVSASVVNFPGRLAVDDSAFVLANFADTTKKVRLYASQLATGVTARLFVPTEVANFHSTLATTSDNSFLGTQNFGNAAVTPDCFFYTNPGSVSGADGSGLKIYDITSNAIAMLCAPSITTNRTYEFPDADGMLLNSVGVASLSNKTLLKNQANVIECAFSDGVLFSNGANHNNGFRFNFATSGTTIQNQFFPNVTLQTVGVGRAGGAPTNQLAKTDSTGIATAIAARNIAEAGHLAGLYQVQYYLETTTADATAGTIAYQVNYTDDVGATNQVTAGTLNLAATTTGATALSGTFTFYSTTAAITYQTNLTGAVNNARYAIRARITYLG